MELCVFFKVVFVQFVWASPEFHWVPLSCIELYCVLLNSFGRDVSVSFGLGCTADNTKHAPCWRNDYSPVPSWGRRALKNVVFRGRGIHGVGTAPLYSLTNIEDTLGGTGERGGGRVRRGLEWECMGKCGGELESWGKEFANFEDKVQVGLACRRNKQRRMTERTKDYLGERMGELTRNSLDYYCCHHVYNPHCLRMT